ncbi:hypothetical protein HMPREF2997_05365 [Staphylococcus sp. HMSC057C08]|uniref:regulatory protein MsaA n=1 Tax=Staphylococcus TaxID=1279 RepID=UPI0003022A49|nr:MULTISPECIES: regulatory protein MsaA [Staphylococcus]OFP27537.1 hypothetical protein HMPREF2997_05365 [Staphylococcus sp. HMSC057C08]
MWIVNIIRADYEGWWLFDDWRDNIYEQFQFEQYEDMLKKYRELICLSKMKFDNFIKGKYNIYAFYNNCDMGFCEDCDEDMQIFYSFIVLYNNEVYYDLPIID